MRKFSLFPASIHTCYDSSGLPALPTISALVCTMLAKTFSLRRCVCALALGLCALAAAANAQQEQPPEQADEVLRISTELVQTDVMVFDKQGHFVENLQRDQFELKIDGKLQPISFFERIKAGSINEDAQLAAARGEVRSNSTAQGTTAATSQATETVVPLDRGRVVIFYIDDLHLSTDSVKRVRDMLLRFIDEEMGQNDQAAITSASGQIGFLQQITGDKTALRAAAQRLAPRSILTRDFERPPMSEQQALNIERYNQDVIDYFVDKLLQDNPQLPRQAAIQAVHGRAQTILEQTAGLTANTLLTLNNLIRSMAQVTGRKLLFFISDGFLIDDQTSNVTSSLRRITDSAARTGVVIYSIDARGLMSGVTDASAAGDVDSTHRLTRQGGGEISATQMALRSLAADTGGRALLNTNNLNAVASTALKETSIYYLLAWRPETEGQENKFRKIEVSVKGRPELTVRVRKGFIEQDEKPEVRRGATEATAEETQSSNERLLLKALQSRSPLATLPTYLFVNYAEDASAGSYITISVEPDSAALNFAATDGKPLALVDVGGLVFNDQGKVVSSFQTQLRITPPVRKEEARPKRGVVYSYQTKLRPGLYQVRVAARDSKSGRIGSAIQWIEIPDMASRRLLLSSVAIGERALETNEARKNVEDAADVFISVSRRLSRNSRLRFSTYIYNAARGSNSENAPDVALQAQILRDNQPVLTTALSKVETKGVQDLARLPFAAEIPLESMPAGRYLLQITVIDRIAKTSATQRISFEIG